MSKKHASSVAAKDTPYRRIVILVAGLAVAIGVFAGISMIARGIGGDEKKIADALVATLKEPYINGQVAFAQQSQTGTMEAKGSFQSENLAKVSLDAKLEGEMQNHKIDVPLQVFGDLKASSVYVHASNLTTLVDMAGANIPAIKADLSAMADKIDGKWLHIEQKDSRAGVCASKLADVVARDEGATKKIINIYKDNRFIEVEKVEDKSPAREYTVHMNDEKLKSFIKALQRHEVYTSIKECKDAGTLFANEPESTQQTQSSSQAQEPEPATVKLTVQDGKIVNLASSSTLNSQMSTSRISLNFAKNKPLQNPQGEVVEYTELQSNMSSLGRIMQEQLQAAQQQSATQQSGAM